MSRRRGCRRTPSTSARCVTEWVQFGLKRMPPELFPRLPNLWISATQLFEPLVHRAAHQSYSSCLPSTHSTHPEKPARARNIMSATCIEEGATHMRSMSLEHGQFRIVGASGRDNFAACFDECTDGSDVLLSSPGGTARAEAGSPSSKVTRTSNAGTSFLRKSFRGNANVLSNVSGSLFSKSLVFVSFFRWSLLALLCGTVFLWVLSTGANCRS